MAKNYKLLHNLSDAQLEGLLRHTLEEDESDIEFINCILEIMENREKGKPNSNLSDIHIAWDEFQKEYNGPDSEKASLYDFPIVDIQGDKHSKRRHISIKKMLLVAIIACFCIVMGASAFDYDIFQAIANWSKDLFSFSYTQIDTTPSSEYEIQNSKQSFANLQEALDALSISEVKAPTWLPKDFEQIEINLLSHLSSKEIQAYYALDDLTIQISITQFNSTYSIQYEKDENPIKEIEINGITHYMFTNNDRSVATWNINLIECSIHGDIPLEEMEELISSMY